VRILVADDQPVVRRGVSSLLSSREDLQVCAEAGDGQEAYLRAIESKPDLVLLDVNMPVLDGFRTAKKIRDSLPETNILMFSIEDGPEFVRVSKFVGAQGFVTKTELVGSLLEAVDTISAGETFFKRPQRRFLTVRVGA
jgi:DNA-binding NarL/FixJ family response regulator